MVDRQTTTWGLEIFEFFEQNTARRLNVGRNSQIISLNLTVVDVLNFMRTISRTPANKCGCKKVQIVAIMSYRMLHE